jgi:hypothetical protein
MSLPYGDPDDLAWFGAGSRPDATEVTDPRAHVGRLTPLDVKLQAFYQGMPLADVMQTAGNVVAGLAGIPDDALSATVQVQASAIRFTFAGKPPAAATGMRADPGASIVLTGRESVQGFQVIREGAADATLAITYWA